MCSGKVVLEARGRVAILRISDPGTRNALSATVAGELADALRNLSPEYRALILTGDPKAFCSGANLGDYATSELGTVDVGEGLRTVLNPVLLAMRDLKIPIVVAVRGAAAGVGAALALCGDLIVAGRSAYFMLAFCRVGLVPDGGVAWLLTRTIGRARAMEMMLLGEKVPAAQALEWGMVNRVMPDDQVEATALCLANRLAEGPTAALAMTRAAAWAASESTFAQHLALDADLQTRAGYHPDFKEGVTAFLEKRPARFGEH